MKRSLGLIFLFLFLAFAEAPAQRVNRTKDLPYVPESSPNFDQKRHRLDVYRPQKTSETSPVVVFLHGGTWMFQSKNWYKHVGKELAKQGFVGIVPNYRLAPEHSYDQIMTDVAKAITWAVENAGYFGGDRQRIYVMGYSAGGHLAAMAALNDEFFQIIDEQSPIKAALLADPYGLDLADMIKTSSPTQKKRLEGIFGQDPLKQERATPLNYLGQNFTPIFILEGGKTYESIEKGNQAFIQTAQNQDHPAEIQKLKRKTHVGMYFFLGKGRNPIYSKIQNYE